MGRVLGFVFALGLCASAVWLAACGCTSPGDAQQGAGDTTYTGTSQSRALLVCQSQAQSMCDLWARCGAQTVGSVVVTEPACGQSITSTTQTCEMNHAEDIAAGSDAQFDGCTAALEALPCTSVCGRIPDNPAACVRLPSYQAMSAVVTCAP
jgi:hypothetical protein